MADFQQKVTGGPAEGLPGQLFDGYFVPTAIGYVSDGQLEAGSFAFMNPSQNVAVPQAKLKQTGGVFLGVVIRTATGQLESPYVDASNKYAANTSVAIAARGRVYYKVPDGKSPSIGKHACVDPATGAVTFEDAGQPNDTGWVVIRYAAGKTSAAGGDIIVIENLG